MLAAVSFQRGGLFFRSGREIVITGRNFRRAAPDIVTLPARIVLRLLRNRCPASRAVAAPTGLQQLRLNASIGWL